MSEVIYYKSRFVFFFNWMCLYHAAPDPNFDKSIEAEHCEKAGNSFEFESSNYKIKTTPKKEYENVVGRRQLDETEKLHNRVIPDPKKLEDLKASKEAKLLAVEILMLTLYTGPMVFTSFLASLC